MRVFAKGTLRAFWRRYPDSIRALEGWYDRVENANWESPQQLKADYPSASILGDNRVVFNIRGQQLPLGGADRLPAKAGLCAVRRHSRRI